MAKQRDNAPRGASASASDDALLRNMPQAVLLQRRIGRLAVRDPVEAKYIAGVCQAIAETPPFCGAWIALLGESGELRQWVWRFSDGVDATPDVLPPGDLPACALDCLAADEPQLWRTNSEACKACPLRPYAPAATIVQVRISHAGDVYGVLGAFVMKDHEAGAMELTLLDELSHSVSFALHAMALERIGQQAQLRQRQSEERFRVVFEQAPDINLILDSDTGRVLDVNHAIVSQLGYARHQVIGYPMQRLFPQESGEGAQELLKQTRVYSSVFASQEFLCKDGDICPMDLSANMIPWGDDTAIHVVLRDARERREHERMLARVHGHLEQRVRQRTAELFKAQQHMQQLIGSLPVVLWSTDATGQYTMFNGTNRHIPKSTLLNMQGKSAFEAGQSISHDETCIRQALQGEVARSVGRVGEGWFETYYMPLRNERAVIEGVTGLMLDITDRRRDELEIRKLSRVATQSASHIVIVDVHGRIEFVNPNVCRATGYEKHELLGQRLLMLRSRQQSMAGFSAVWNTVKQGHEWRGELVAGSKQGTVLPVLCSISPIRDDDGAVSHFVMVAQDISEMKRVQDDLRRTGQRLAAFNEHLEDMVHSSSHELAVANRQLATLDQAKRSFLELVNHELRTPLNGIVGLTRLLDESISSDDREIVDLLNQSVRRLHELSESVLLVTQLSAGSYSLHLERFAIGDMLHAVAAEFQLRYPERQLLLHEPVQATLRTDPTLFRMALMLLLENAVRGGDRRKPVELRTGSDEKTAYVAVVDFGKKLTEEQLEENFLELQWTNPKHHDRGLGLGLPAVQLIMQRLGGALILENRKEGGANIRLVMLLE